MDQSSISSTFTMSFVNLPDVVHDNVYNFLLYDDISRSRRVCSTMDKVGRRHLNRGFQKLQLWQKSLYKDIKGRLPRRESQRHNHALSRHMEVLTSVGTRLCLLEMTYGKYMKDNVCCFIPGKVLDEAFRLLRMIKKEHSIPRSFDVIQELRDISGMAMEHFEENIAPRLTARSFSFSSLLSSASTSSDALKHAYRRSVAQQHSIPTPLSGSCSEHGRSSLHHPLVSFSASQQTPSTSSSAAHHTHQPTTSTPYTPASSSTSLPSKVTSMQRELQQVKFRLQRSSTRCLKLKAQVQGHAYKHRKQSQQIAELKEKLAEQKKFTETLASRLTQLESGNGGVEPLPPPPVLPSTSRVDMEVAATEGRPTTRSRATKRKATSMLQTHQDTNTEAEHKARHGSGTSKCTKK